MSLLISIADLPKEGVQVSQEVEPAQLDLSSEEGDILGMLQCAGVLMPADSRCVAFQGRIWGMVLRECVRCLSSFQDTLDASFEAMFRPSSSGTETQKPRSQRRKIEEGDLEEDSDEEEAFPIVDHHVDLLPVVREQVILATPIQPLCHEQCLGLCQQCGVNLNEETCGCSAGPLDPRMSVLSKISL